MDDSENAGDGVATGAVDSLPGVLSGEQIRARIEQHPPLVEAYVDLDQQLQPNGIDLTVRSVSRYQGPGVLASSNAGRVLPELVELPFEDGWLTLPAGPYQIVHNEIVNIPVDLMALGRPRSSLGRCGVTIHTAVWDAGYRGRSTSLLVVNNPAGFRLERDARVMQLVFFGLSRPAGAGYAGVYQGENIAGG